VRPLVNSTTLKNCFQALELHSAVIPVLPIKESIRKLENNLSKAENRSFYRIVQTPQCFHSEIIKNAYKQDFHIGITDDATLIEEMGTPIHLVEGNEENIKITTAYDLKIAELFIQEIQK
jgi:2-C-methyl-D-erythritol 4-phosphate cytidylyltransferase